MAMYGRVTGFTWPRLGIVRADRCDLGQVNDVIHLAPVGTQLNHLLN